MKRDPSFKVVHIRWWHRPVRLAMKHGEGFDFIGWVWNQKAYLVRNLNHGWIAFAEDQTPENVDVWYCDHCGGSLWGTRRSKILEALKKEGSK
jgi:hypothetical protein